MCLLQFVKMYETTSVVPKNLDWSDGVCYAYDLSCDDDFSNVLCHKDFHKIVIKFNNEKDMPREIYERLLLPKYISVENPQPGEPKFLRLRSVPAVVRMHKFSRSEEHHEYIYSELLLYRPFITEDELGENDEKMSAELYLETALEGGKTKIEIVKSILMEHLESVQEGKEKAEMIMSTSAGELLDSQYEQEEDDAIREGMIQHPDHEAITIPENMKEGNDGKADSFYCPVKLSTLDELYDRSRKLDKEQMLVLQEAIQFAKQIVKYSAGDHVQPNPPLVMVHGGAGSGKSTVIRTIIEWMERILRKEGDSPDHPYILACAPTGTAAAIIKGQTLHHSFSFNFGNEFMSLSDKARDVKRTLLRNLKAVIIDEISMVKADLLYQLDQRLREVKEEQDKLFGGVSIFCFGDLLQLRPVNARYVFEESLNQNYAISYALEPLWHSFKIINLVQNHRQGNDMIYADILNRIRIGKVTDDDCSLLETRVRSMNDPDLPTDAMYVTCTNAAVKEVNDARLQSLSTEYVVLHAININSAMKKFTPPIGKGGSVHTTPFVNELHLKVNARVMLVYNIDTIDGLTNGAMGEVIGFLRGKNREVTQVIVNFDGEDVGSERRKKTSILLKNYPDKRPTPITRQEFAYSLSRKSSTSSQAKVIQFPLRLAFAATAHKFQGQTVQKPKSLVVDLRTVREPAQAYVMLSRVQEITQLFILERLPIEKLKPSEIALAEVDRLNSVSLNNNLPGWYSKSDQTIKIVFLNTRSLPKHHQDITNTWPLCSSDMLCLSETWLPSIYKDNGTYDISGFNQPHFVSHGRGKGLATYATLDFQASEHINLANCQISVIENAEVKVITVYRSSSASVHVTLSKILSLHDETKIVVIVGDFNVDSMKDPHNALSVGLKNYGFSNLSRAATHIQGGCIDHCYIKLPGNPCGAHLSAELVLMSLYWTDHDALILSLS